MPLSLKATAGRGGGFHDPFDIFREVFGGGGGGGGGIFETFFGGGATTDREGRQRGSDLRYDMQITLEEAAFGVEKEIEVRKLDTCGKCDGKGAESGSRTINCPTCGGRGQVISSRGFFQVSQTCPRCRGVGPDHREAVPRLRWRRARRKHEPHQAEDAGRHRRWLASPLIGQRRGGNSRRHRRAIFTSSFTSRSTPIFQREDDNLYCEVPIAFTLAALGGEIAVPTLEGKANLKVPAGTQSGQVFKLRGKGIMNVNARDRGDLLARLLVEVPTPFEQRATPEARGIRRALRRRKHAASQKLLRSREGIFSVIRPRIRGCHGWDENSANSSSV